MSWKAYNPAWPLHEAMHAATARWHRRGLLAPAQQLAIQTAYPLDFYRPGLFLRIGLFIFACIGAFGGAVFFALLTEFDHLKAVAAMCGLGTLAALEFFIRNSRLYHAGADQALLYITLGWFTVFLVDAVSDAVPYSARYGTSLGSSYLFLILWPLFLLFLVATIRYADRLVAAGTYLLLLLLMANWLLQFPVGRLMLPFVLMLASGAAYWLVKRLGRRPDYLYYRPCLLGLQALALATFYLGGNYYIVREGNAQISGEYVSSQIPFAPLFYLFTASIPLVYIAIGLRRPSRIWLLTGLAAAVFSIFTLRYYRALMPPEIAAVLAGTVLLALAAWAARYLRPARHGLTSLPNDDHSSHFNLESLVVAQTAVVPQAPPPGFQFGGGHSGGGGAEGSF
ncbi:hypothetical protein KBK19_02400 [Microvirga sp. STR05]|uniref:DUF2157 domain-containing protein n=1 Tax=Hymenobacter duratus TaxID=2771356 RepID=A0ABR8JE98_9BACT|nr:hypothetical protein [Hymenobacter duratus]MBD2713881.1 hypothetical protein [Hymenobacter duratus]MBR7948783.1 hypothetical protein [Microvirga sp. STR05]